MFSFKMMKDESDNIYQWADYVNYVVLALTNVDFIAKNCVNCVQLKKQCAKEMCENVFDDL